MKNQAKYALVFSAAYIVVKNAAYLSGIENSKNGKLIGLISLFFVLLAIFLTLRENRQYHPNPHFLSEVKLGAKTGGIYALISAVYVFIHFSFVSPMLQQKLNEAVQHQTKILNKDFFDSKEVILVNQDLTIRLNPEFEKNSYGETYVDDKIMKLKGVIDQAKIIYRPLVYTTITLIGLMLLTFFYSFGVTFLLRKLPSV